MKSSTDEMLKKIISKKLYIIRRILDVSQQQIADFAGISTTKYSRWENGKASPDILSLKKIVTDFFQISMDDFLNENIPAEAHLDIWKIRDCTFTLTDQKQQCNNAEKAKILIKNRLPVLRKMGCFTPQMLIDRFNISKDTYFCWENGKSLPDTMMLKIIVTDISNYSLDNFLDESLPVEKLLPLQNNVKSREKTLRILVRERLPELREKAGISQNEMATYLGVSKTLYINWEQGNTLIDVLSLRKIVVEVLHIPFDEFLNNAIPIKTLTSQFDNGLMPVLLNAREKELVMRTFRNKYIR